MIRNANISDAQQIQKVVNTFAKQGEMLTLSLSEIYEKIFEFAVWEEDGNIVGCCALHPTWDNLAEVRSLAVDSSQAGKGVGKALIERCLEKAQDIGISKIFALTYQVDFFQKQGFITIDKDRLPQKIWSDCLKCVKFPHCDEIAVLIDLQEK